MKLKKMLIFSTFCVYFTITFSIGRCPCIANMSLGDMESKLQSFERKLANLTDELEKERNIRFDLEKSLNELKMRNESTCTAQCSESDQSYVLLLLGDLQQQLQLLKDSKVSMKRNDSQQDMFIQKELRKLSVSLFDLGYAVSVIKNASLGNADLIKVTTRQIEDLQLRLNVTNAKDELLKVFQLQQQIQLNDHSGDINHLKRDMEEFINRTEQNYLMTQQQIKLESQELNETIQLTRDLYQRNAMELASLNMSLIDIETNIQELQNITSENMKEVTNNITNIQVEHMEYEDKVMFSATIPSSRTLLNFNSQTLPFTHVITKHGNGYNTGTGVFTAPANGYFIFFWEIQVPPGKICDTAFKKNGAQILGLGADARGDAGSQSASKTVILALVAGDEVLIRTGRCDAIYMCTMVFTPPLVDGGLYDKTLSNKDFQRLGSMI